MQELPGSWLGIAGVLLTTLAAAVAALWKQIIEQQKEIREMSEARNKQTVELLEKMLIVQEKTGAAIRQMKEQLHSLRFPNDLT